MRELSRIHSAGGAHRRIAPDALWFSPHGVLNAQRFSEAARDAPSVDPLGEFERFRAPEEFAEICDAISDCYSIGILLLEAVTGNAAPEAAARHKRSIVSPSHFPDWSEEFIGVVNRSLSISRDRRFQSAVEMCTALAVESAAVETDRAPNDVPLEHDRPADVSVESPVRGSNPDPSPDWTHEPSDEGGLFAKPDSAVASSFAGGLACFAASTRGSAHARDGQYREDDFAMHFVAPVGWHVFIVADGAGSAEFSRRGAQIVCESGLHGLRHCLERSNALDDTLATLGEPATDGYGLEELRRIASDIFSKVAYDALVDLHRQAASGGAHLRDFATTFLAVLARPVGAGWLLVSFSVGDGGAAVVVDAQTVVVLSHAGEAELADRATSITMLELFKDPRVLLARTNVIFCNRFQFLALMTEGFRDPVFQSDAGFANTARWTELRERLGGVVDFQRPAEGTERLLLDWLHERSFGNGDDRTLILAVPTGA